MLLGVQHELGGTVLNYAERAEESMKHLYTAVEDLVS